MRDTLGSRLTGTAGWEPGLLYSFAKETIMDMTKYYSYNEEDCIEIEYEAVTFIDFLKMAKNSWDIGAPFDVDMKIIKDSDRDTPVKILQRKTVEINGDDMYEVWGGVATSNPYLVPIRIYATLAEYHDSVFPWKVEVPAQNVNVDDLISALENEEDSKWEDLLQ
jgi:hypothetical protein